MVGESGDSEDLVLLDFGIPVYLVTLARQCGRFDISLIEIDSEGFRITPFSKAGQKFIPINLHRNEQQVLSKRTEVVNTTQRIRLFIATSLLYLRAQNKIPQHRDPPQIHRVQNISQASPSNQKHR